MSEYRTLNAVAYDHLRDLIYNGELEYGRIYSETKLAARLSISRTPIRDALNRLAQERYIDILPNRGFLLHKPTREDLIEACHVRMMVEGYCADSIARHYPDERTCAVIGHMEQMLLSQRRLLEDEENYSLTKFWQEDVCFHKSMIEYMNISLMNIPYEGFMHFFMPHYLAEDRDVHHLQLRTLERHRSTLVEHAEIIQALRSHDTERLRTAIRTHLDSGLRALYFDPDDD